jgi:adenylyltransferase/sulfurtransferase
MAPLRPDQALRYARQLSLPAVGAEGQARLLDATVALVGVGGLGSPLALYLAAAGVGRLILIDADRVERSNLHRQILYGTSDEGRLKVEAAAERLRDLNADTVIEAHAVRLDASNVMELLADADVVADGSDNFPTRYLVSDACVLLRKPNAHGSIHRFEGQVSWFDSRTGPCFRCLHPEPPPPGLVPSCAEAGVLGALPGVVGSMQATEVLKHLLRAGESLSGRLILYDALSMTFRELRLRKDPDCPACGPASTLRKPTDLEGYCTTPPAPAVSTPEPATEFPAVLDAMELQQLLDGADAPLVLDVREDWEFHMGSLPGARHMPLHVIPARWQELPSERAIVTVCHMGVRSHDAMRFLRSRGFPRVASLDGGTEAWSALIDPSLPRY